MSRRRHTEFSSYDGSPRRAWEDIRPGDSDDRRGLLAATIQAPTSTPASDEHSSSFGRETMEAVVLREGSCESSRSASSRRARADGLRGLTLPQRGGTIVSVVQMSLRAVAATSVVTVLVIGNADATRVHAAGSAAAPRIVFEKRSRRCRRGRHRSESSRPLDHGCGWRQRPKTHEQ